MPDFHWPPPISSLLCSFSPVSQAPSEPTPALLLHISEILRLNWGTSIESWRPRVMDRDREKSSKLKPDSWTRFIYGVSHFALIYITCNSSASLNLKAWHKDGQSKMKVHNYWGQKQVDSRKLANLSRWVSGREPKDARLIREIEAGTIRGGKGVVLSRFKVILKFWSRTWPGIPHHELSS